MKFEMKKFKLLVISLLLITSITIINSCKTKDLGTNGKYTTANIQLLDALILRAKFGGDFTYQIEMVLDLKEDSTFQIGFCQRKIAFVGNWKIEGDSVLLYNVFSYYSNKRVDSYKVYWELEDKKIFFPNKTKRIIKGKDTVSTTYTVLKINGKGFDGILNKGFVRPLDSTAKN